MAKIFIDEKPVDVAEGTTVFKACELAGIPIPHLCYYPAFLPEGSCRMCLVEIEGFPKLELACSTQVKEGMKVQTESPKVVEARKGVLEFLLAEHPLDCPICDKAGECKLQDYYEEYGLFKAKFKEVKEKREKKVSLGKNLLLDRERCVLCTRCVRFLSEVTKTQETGVFHRGIHSGISTLERELVDNNYSGNLAELCPVGAITDSDFRFKTRSWFLEKKESLCPLCSRGCGIFVEYHPGFPRVEGTRKTYRIKARENPNVNGFWICDKGRYFYSYLEEGRQEKISLNKEGKETGLSWEKALGLLAEKIKTLYFMKRTSRIAVVLNTVLTNEELFLAEKLFRETLGMDKIYIADPADGEADGFLLTPERTPNKRGAKEISENFKPIDWGGLADKTDLLLVFGNFLADHFSLAEIKRAFDKIGTKFLFTAHQGSLNSAVDVVFPVTLIAEKGGSLTNIDGRIQKFTPAMEPKGEGLPEWKILVELARELKLNYRYFNQFAYPEIVYNEMGKEIPFFK